MLFFYEITLMKMRLKLFVLWLFVVSMASKSVSQNITLDEIWNRATQINDEIRTYFPNWYFYNYDDNAHPFDSIIDGGMDLYDGGNMVKFYEGDSEPLAPLQYGNSYNYETYDVRIARNMHPFMALAWINNMDGEEHNYTIQVDGNLGADGSGNITTSGGSITSDTGDGDGSADEASASLTAMMEYHTFQVHNADYGDPTICEIYITLSYEEWNSIAADSFDIVQFTNETDEISNSVRLTGSPKNVVLGYVLLSVTNGALIQESDIRAFLTQLMQNMLEPLPTTTPAPVTTPPPVCHVDVELNGTGFSNISSQAFLVNSAYYYFCDYTFQAESGYKIEIVLKVDLGSRETLTIYDGSSRIGSINGHVNRTLLVSSGNFLRLRYSTYNRFSGGFSATYRQFLPTCGFTTYASSTTQNITSPDYPSNYGNLTECIWTIRWSSQRPLNLTIHDIEVADDDDAYLEIYESFPNWERLNNSIKSPTTMFYTSGNLRIRYHAEPSTRIRRFKATIHSVTCGVSYEGNENTTTVRATYPNVNLPYYLNCYMNFQSQSGKQIEILVQHDNDAPAQHLYFYDNGAYIRNNYNRWNANQNFITSNGGILQLRYDHQTSYGNTTDAGFNVTYRQFERTCGSTYTASTSPQNITSPGYPNITTNLTDCFWIIRSVPINFTLIHLEINNGDYLEISDGVVSLTRYNASITSPVTFMSTTGNLRIRYHAEQRNDTTNITGGFLATFMQVSCDKTYLLRENSTNTVTPSYPRINNFYNPYYFRDCNIIFEAQDGYLIEVLVRFFRYSYHQVYDGNIYLGTVSYYNYPRNHFTSSGKTLRFRNYNRYYNDAGYTVTYKQFEHSCGYIRTANSTIQTITSPGYPNKYNSLDECFWLIQSENNQLIWLVINYLETETNNDYLEILNGYYSIGKYSGLLTSPVYHTSSRNGNLRIRFHSDANNVTGGGFTAKYKQVACGNAIAVTNTYSNSFYVPNSIYNAPVNVTCDYVFHAQSGYQVHIEIVDRNPNSCCEHIEIFNGDDYVGTMNGELQRTSILSTGQQLSLHYVANNNAANNYFYRTRFRVYYRQFIPTCGSTVYANSTLQTITSPGYPGNYENNQNCVWFIHALPQQEIRFTLNFLDAEGGDYLEVRDGLKSLASYTNVITSPISILSTTDKLQVHFYSDRYSSRKGFTASFVEVINACLNQPCLNNGVCVRRGITFECACPEGFEGFLCETFISPCASNPCLNGGQCYTTNSGEFGCFCPVGFTGNLCFDDVNECLEDPCAENASCTDIRNGFTCTCNKGYRGDGKIKCYEIVLLPYGEEVGDSLLPATDDAISPVITLDFGIPFGSQSYFNFRITSNGLIYFAPELYWAQSLNRPFSSGFDGKALGFGLIAPFWDDFHPTIENSGRVYYQSYNKVSNSLNNSSVDLIAEVRRRISNKFNVPTFDPLYLLKATWKNVVMFPEDYPGHRNYPSTFQAILATDGCDTYLLYIYEEDSMLWKVGIRSSDNVLIGYTNGAELSYDESQGDYRPDQHVQRENGDQNGQYFYKLTPTSSPTQQSRCRCLQWYLEDLNSNWTPSNTPCPCSSFQASVDSRFARSVDYNLWRNNINYPDQYQTADISEWEYDTAPIGQCYQLREGTGPRCCYIETRRFFSTWWGLVISGPLLRGPLSSRQERFQIPLRSENDTVDTRDEIIFEQQYNDALQGDLIPRRQCCIESISSGYCKMYERRRPQATCSGYFARVPSFLWGDPHITTIDGLSYTFNGLGEYHLIYAPDVFSLQARTKKVEKEDGTLSDATGFVAFAAQDHTSSSGRVQFDVDRNSDGTGVVVMVDGIIQSGLSEVEKIVQSITLSVNNGSYEATFPSLQSVTVSAASYLLTVQFTGDPDVLQNVSKGLLGHWTGAKEDDFELRNGTVLNLDQLKVTNDLDILNGTYSEKKLYAFGQSWQVTKTESLFNYTGGNDTYETHNPTSTTNPLFLEELVSDQRNTTLFNGILSNCTNEGIVSTPCLYDTLSTNRTDIGQATLRESISSATAAIVNSNNPPNITVSENTRDFVNGFFQVKISESATLLLEADDSDGDSVTFSIVSPDQFSGITIDTDTGVITWTLTSGHTALTNGNASLVVQATDSKGGESLLTIPVKLCSCLNNGSCLFDMTLSGSDNFQVVGCDCTEAWSGDDCSDDRNACEFSACYVGVTCSDEPAPGIGETCGPCPDGTTGNGRNCTTINLCESNPCSQICESVFGGYTCSCYDGFRVNETDPSVCDDIDECVEINPCSAIFNSYCVNDVGNYSCECNSGYEKNNNSICNDINECDRNLHNCSLGESTCYNQEGSFGCSCKSGFTRPFNASVTSTCYNEDECALETDGCNRQTETCVNTDNSYYCVCAPGYQNDTGTCENINECLDSSLNNCSLTSTQCNDTEGSFVCVCGYGFTGNGTICDDINECDVNPCPSNSLCNNTAGSYTCDCTYGYVMVSGICVEVTTTPPATTQPTTTEQTSAQSTTNQPTTNQPTTTQQTTSQPTNNRTQVINLTCPDINDNCAASRISNWLCEYIDWRVAFLHEWQAVFEVWRLMLSPSEHISRPTCLNLTVSCINPIQWGITKDYYACGIPYCHDGYYNHAIGLNEWLMDLNVWKKNMKLWRRAYNGGKTCGGNPLDYQGFGGE